VRLAVFCQAVLNRGKQILIAKRLGQKLHRAGFHRPHRHRNITVAGDENDRQLHAGLGESIL
jgi:hypothetical protein